MGGALRGEGGAKCDACAKCEACGDLQPACRALLRTASTLRVCLHVPHRTTPCVRRASRAATRAPTSSSWHGRTRGRPCRWTRRWRGAPRLRTPARTFCLWTRWRARRRWRSCARSEGRCGGAPGGKVWRGEGVLRARGWVCSGLRARGWVC
eukprot:357713-Chlamydomonas_euryale.AAC.24